MSKTHETKETKDAKASGKIRVFALAAELNLETKAVLDICKELGYSGIKNQLNVLEPEQVDAVRDRVKRGPSKPASASPSAPASPKAAAPPKIEQRMPTLSKPKSLPGARPAPQVAIDPPAVVSEPVAEPYLSGESMPTLDVVKPRNIAFPPNMALEAGQLGETAETYIGPRTPQPVTPTPVEVEGPVTPAGPLAAPEEQTTEIVPNQVVSAASPPLPPVKGFAPPRPVSAGKPPVLGARVQVLPPRPTPIVPATPAAAASTPSEPVVPAAEAPKPVEPLKAVVEAPKPVEPPKPAAEPPKPAPPMAQRPSGVVPLPGARPMNPGSGVRPLPTARSPYPAPTPGPARPPQQQQGGGGSVRAGGMPPRHSSSGTAAPRVGIGAPLGAYAGPGTKSGAPGSRPPQGQGQGQGGPGPQGGSPKPTPPGQPKQVKLTLEQIERLRNLERIRGKAVTFNEVAKATAPAVEKPGEKAAPGREGAAAAPPRRGGVAPTREEEDDRRGGGGGGGAGAGAGKKPGEVAGRDQRHKSRQDKGRRPGGISRGAVVIGAGGRVDIIEEHSGSRIKKHRGKAHVKPPTVVTGGRIEIALPITVRSLSEAIGMKVGELILKLKNLTNSLYTINSGVEFDVAELIATEKNIELAAKKQITAESELERALVDRKATVDNLVLRAPIVTIMGHVDHGKTSLLDRIRREYGLSSDVVSSEVGGITQVLRAWRVEKDGKSTTFLDTPGHEAFTKMRARGANVTDIAVIVVSAADGVKPQTEEAISHAKAADVDIVVAINKIDLPDADVEKTRRQLYQLELLPDTMGGDVPFVECSAKSGVGIDELLDSIAILSELAELKADPNHPGSGTCLEAYMEGDRGVVATLLVRDGTLRRGDVVLCGATYGRVRAMYDDLGRPIDEAGPSTPVKFIGLNDCPDADDTFHVVDDIAAAREIAEKRLARRVEAARDKFSPVSLDKLKEQNSRAKISELKVILKAEARGSVEAIKKELEKLQHEEVRVRVLHAAIGAITESDVTLSLTSPDDTMIVGFNVTADDAALKLSESRGVSIREYQIIYNLVDDVKAALEGRLKPVEEVVHLGRAVVRNTFKISKVGTIAGCYVTSGTIERSAKVRVIRDGTVLFPPAEKTVGLDSLKRFKDDVKEVREGFECGMKVVGFDDVKVGDVIEAYRIDIKQRTL